MEIHSTQISYKTQGKLYWLLQLVGWVSLMVIEIFNFTFFIQGEFHWRYFYSFGVFSVIGLFTTHFYKTLFIQKSTFERGLGKIWIKALLDVALISLLMVILGRLISIFGKYSILKMSIEETLWVLGPQFMNIARYVVVWITIYYLYHILLRNNKLQRANLEAENNAKIAELELLKTQLNPQFLFQSLSSIKALVLNNKEKARDGIIKLSELLRYSLNYNKNSLVSVHEELSELNKYVELEKLRLGARLAFTVDMDEFMLNEKIPTAVLLNLAENAIRNGIEKQENGGELNLRGNLNDDNIQFCLSLIKTTHSANQLSQGMENFKIRLEKIYGDKARLYIENANDESVLSTLEFPKNTIK
ncbi:MAG: histidine kinase [Cyclobacteriaceae bacterium]|nr:histidine kinase [Cyclobacteriaceae bacterium]